MPDRASDPDPHGRPRGPQRLSSPPLLPARRLVLLAERSPGSGKARVLLGRDRLKVMDLSGSAGPSTRVDLTRVTDPVAGRVRIVAAGGKSVRIDALAVVETP